MSLMSNDCTERLRGSAVDDEPTIAAFKKNNSVTLRIKVGLESGTRDPTYALRMIRRFQGPVQSPAGSVPAHRELGDCEKKSETINLKKMNLGL